MKSTLPTTRNSKGLRDAVISVELLLVSIVAVAMLMVAFASLRDAAMSELSDVAGSVDDLSQSFTFAGASSQSSTSPGSGYTDQTDSPSVPEDVANVIDNDITFTAPIDEFFGPLVSAQFEAEGPDVSVTTGGPDPEGWIVWSNGELFTIFDVPESGTYRFSARLWGQQAGAELPNAAFRVDGVPQANFDINPTGFATAEVILLM